MKDKLKPCPFCGGEAKIVSRRYSFYSDEKLYHIECKCGITTRECLYLKSLEEYWNRRDEKYEKALNMMACQIVDFSKERECAGCPLKGSGIDKWGSSCKQKIVEYYKRKTGIDS